MLLTLVITAVDRFIRTEVLREKMLLWYEIYIAKSHIFIIFLHLFSSTGVLSHRSSFLLYNSFFYLPGPYGMVSVSFWLESGAEAAGLWSPDAGERETRPAPSRVRPYAHAVFLRASICPWMFIQVCVCVAKTSGVIALASATEQSKCVRKTQKNTHIHTHLLIHWRMTVRERDESSWLRQNESLRDKHRERRWDYRLSGVRIFLCFPKEQEEGWVSISLFFFN